MPTKALPLLVPPRTVAALAALFACAQVGAALAQTASSRAGAGAPALSGAAAPNTGLRLDDSGVTLPDPAAGSPGAPNYGRPVKRVDPRLSYPGRRKTPRTPLPALVPSPAASVQRAGRSAPTPLPEEAMPAPQPPPTVAVLPQPPRKARPKVEEDPYAPVGIGVGNLRLVPYLSEDLGYDSNPNRTSTGGRGSPLSRTEGGLSLRSDWSRHALTGEIHGAYTDVFRDPSASRPEGQGQLNLRIDASRDTQLNFDLRGSLDTQRPGSAELSATSVKARPLVATMGAGAGATQAFGPVSLGLRGTIDRTTYEDATLLNGSTLALSANDYTAYGVQGHLAYQLNPAVAPFIDVQADTRRRDEPIDPDGFARNSTGVAVRIGSSFELSRLITGQAAVGYLTRDYADPRLSRLSAPTFDAALIWTATPLTTVSLRGTTVASETTVAGASGSINRAMSVELSHALFRNLKLGAIATLGTSDYQGIALREKTLTGTLKAEYSLTRSISVRGSFTHERLQSTAAGADYTANVFLLGLKLQR